MADIINVAIKTGLDQIDVSISDDLTVVNTALFEINETVNVSIDQGVIVVSDLSSLLDVNISSLQDGQYLVYDSTTSKWINTSNEYKHHQNNSAMIWDITHNLNLANYLPNVTIKLNGGLIINPVQAMGLIEYVDQNRLKINFLTSKSGYAYIKK